MDSADKRLTVRLTAKEHTAFMVWCRIRGARAQTVVHNLILGIMQSKDPAIVEHFCKERKD